MKNLQTLQNAIFRNSAGANAELAEIVLMLKEYLNQKNLSPADRKLYEKDMRCLIQVIKQVRDLEIMQSFAGHVHMSEQEIEKKLFTQLNLA